MPNRIVREGIIESEKVNNLTPSAELFYRRLMSKVDDYGRFHGHPALILAACYPLQLDRITQANITAWVDECEKNDLITRYESGGKRYVSINNFGQRERTDSKFPAPCAQNVREMLAEREQPADTLQARARARSESESESESYAESGKAAPHAVWASDEVFCRFVGDYRATGAPLIDEDFIAAYQFAWLKLDWEQKAERVKSLARHQQSYTEAPNYVPKPRKFLEQEWKRPPRVNGKPSKSEAAKPNPIFRPEDYGIPS